MTHHRLVRCEVADLVALATRRHPLPRHGLAPSGGRRWFVHGTPPPGSRSISWTAALPGPQRLDVVWWLELEPGATCVLAHLTAEAVPQSWPLPPPVHLAVHAWSSRELAALAREAEAGLTAA